jgi:hypothetical protein
MREVGRYVRCCVSAVAVRVDIAIDILVRGFKVSLTRFNGHGFKSSYAALRS